MELIIGIIAIFALFFVLKILSLPLRIIKNLVINGILGLIIIWIVNLFGSLIGINLEINVINALIAGFFGIPGVIVLIILNFLN